MMPTTRGSQEPSSWLSLKEVAVRLGQYRWLELKLFELLGAWVQEVPEPEVKALLGIHCRHHGWHAELWRDLLPEVVDVPEVGDFDSDGMTAPADCSVPAFFEKMAEATSPELTIEKLVGVYRVLIPRKIVAYTQHLDESSPVSDAPTIRCLNFALQDEIAGWREGETMIQQLLQVPGVADRAASWQAATEVLVRGGGAASGSGS